MKSNTDERHIAAGQQGAGEVLDKHGIAALHRCEKELAEMIKVAADYDLDELAVQALETAIESMRLRRLATPKPPKPAGAVPLPSRLIVMQHPLESDEKVEQQRIYAAGWNGCIDYIEKCSPMTQKPACPCNLTTCVEPWEPGCGLGTSEEHARKAEYQTADSVPIPEPCYSRRSEPCYYRDQLIAYGDAREAAAKVWYGCTSCDNWRAACIEQGEKMTAAHARIDELLAAGRADAVPAPVDEATVELICTKIWSRDGFNHEILWGCYVDWERETRRRLVRAALAAAGIGSRAPSPQPMTTQGEAVADAALIERRARAFLAREYERDGCTAYGADLRDGPVLDKDSARAVRAIAAALTAPQPKDATP